MMTESTQLHLLLLRDVLTPEATCGKLYINNEFECYTLEDTDRVLEANPGGKLYGRTAIPRGVYKVILSLSNRFKRVLPEVRDVPGFAGIRIHPGNSAKDTEGCILVGRTRGANYVGQSKLAFDALFEQLSEAGLEITLEIR